MEKQFLSETLAAPAAPANGQMPSSLELAFVGDTLYDLYVRGRLIGAVSKVKNLHAAAASQVNATAQSNALERIEPLLSEAEQDVVRRARNAKQHAPKNANPRDYHRATGFEALLGYLYLRGDMNRINELMALALNP